MRIYAPDEAPLPNPRGKAFLDALNHGALIVNFSGHGAAGAMQYLFSTAFPDWEYLNQVRNRGRLPLILALSCLNGLFTLPAVEALSELMTEHEERRRHRLHLRHRAVADGPEPAAERPPLPPDLRRGPAALRTRPRRRQGAGAGGPLQLPRRGGDDAGSSATRPRSWPCPPGPTMPPSIWPCAAA